MVGAKELREIEPGSVEARHGGEVVICDSSELDCVDISVRQMFSASTLMIPFLNHNDANRALMGANMQRQALPLVATGMEREISRSPAHSVWADVCGTVIQASEKMVKVWPKRGPADKKEAVEYPVRALARSNQNTFISQRTRVMPGQVVKVGDCLADGYASDGGGETALGQNVLVAFLSWEGYNYEDSIVVSERMVGDGKFMSMHIMDHHVIVRKESTEEITCEVPHLSRVSRSKLDENGLVRVGVRVSPGDVLVAKRTPRGDMSDDEALLIGMSEDPLVRRWRDTSLLAGKSAHGVVTSSRMVSGGAEDPLPTGASEMARVSVARVCPLAVGDKMSGRHGNKGLVSVVMPVEDMPTLPDGTPVDVVLNPLGVPSRMNLGQLMEVHLGMAAARAGFYAETPAFDGASWIQIQDAMAESYVPDRFARMKNGGDEWPRLLEAMPGFAEREEGWLVRTVLLDWLRGRGRMSRRI